jgi:SAM-dependent methyltransferase
VDTYTHGHADPVLQSHRWRTVDNSAGYLAPELRPGLDVLDVGCGPGTMLVRLAQAGASVTGIDLVAGHVEQAQRNLGALGLAGRADVADAEALPYEDASFDRVVSNNALQFTGDLDAALREIRRVLRPRGWAHIVVYHRRSAYFWWRFVLLRGLLGGDLLRFGSMGRVIGANIPWGRRDGSLVASALTGRQLRRALVEAGLTEPATVVHGFSWAHLAPPGLLIARLPGALPALLSRIFESRVGWYLAGVARRPG